MSIVTHSSSAPEELGSAEVTLLLGPAGLGVSQAPPATAILGMGRCKEVRQEGAAGGHRAKRPPSQRCGAEEPHFGITRTLQLSSRPVQRKRLPAGCVAAPRGSQWPRARDSAAAAGARAADFHGMNR